MAGRTSSPRTPPQRWTLYPSERQPNRTTRLGTSPIAEDDQNERLWSRNCPASPRHVLVGQPTAAERKKCPDYRTVRVDRQSGALAWADPESRPGSHPRPPSPLGATPCFGSPWRTPANRHAVSPSAILGGNPLTPGAGRRLCFCLNLFHIERFGKRSELVPSTIVSSLRPERAEHSSPGSAKRRSRGAPPWATMFGPFGAGFEPCQEVSTYKQ